MNIPDWVSAAASVLAVVGGLGGAYATMKSEDALILYQVEKLNREYSEGRDYDGVLTEEIDEIKIDLAKQDLIIQSLVVSQDKLGKGMEEIAKAVNKMNEILIRQEERYAKKEND